MPAVETAKPIQAAPVSADFIQSSLATETPGVSRAIHRQVGYRRIRERLHKKRRPVPTIDRPVIRSHFSHPFCGWLLRRRDPCCQGLSLTVQLPFVKHVTDPMAGADLMCKHSTEGKAHSGRWVELDCREKFLSQSHVFLSPQRSCLMPSPRERDARISRASARLAAI